MDGIGHSFPRQKRRIISGQIITTSLFSLTGIMVNKRNHPKMPELFRVYELFIICPDNIAGMIFISDSIMSCPSTSLKRFIVVVGIHSIICIVICYLAMIGGFRWDF